jgi:hypothetical protein
MASVGVIPNLFVGAADACERMVAGLQYCSFLPLPGSATSTTQRMRPMTIQQITSFVEKGILYREMIDLRELTLLDQAFYITQKFTEFGERYANRFTFHEDNILSMKVHLMTDWK